MAPKRTAFIQTVLVLTLNLILTRYAADAVLTYPCPPAPNGGNVRPPENSLPHLPDQFVVHVEANILQKQSTSEAVEVYDYPNRRAAMSITTNNDTTTSIFNYATGERFDLLPDGSCKTVNLSVSSFDVFGFTELTRTGTPTIMKVNDVFRFGDDVKKTFLGETEVRGVPVYHWQTCQTWKVRGEVWAAYVLEYYFSKPEYSTATKTSMIPVRAVINGTAVYVDADGKKLDGQHTFSHVYDFSFFRPGPVEDESLFEIPRGTVCKDRLVTKPLPRLPDQFSLSMEVFVAGTSRPPMTERMLYDYDFGLIQTDRFAPRGRGERFGLTKLTIVEDYQNHVQYVIDGFDGNCTISPMPEGLSTSGQGHGSQITMRHGPELLRFNDRSFVYQGQRTMRDMRVDVWANASGGMVQEIYFLANWPTSQMRQRLQRVNLELDLSRMNMLVGTYLLNTSAINTGVGPFFELFGDRALRNRWRQDESYPPRRPMLPQEHAHGNGQMRRTWWGRSKPWSWDSVRRHLNRAGEKIINIYNYLPMHMDLSAFDVSTCYKKAGRELYVYFMLEGGHDGMITSQRYVFMSSTKSAVAKAANITTLRISNVNVWQDLMSSKLNFFFSVLEPPPVPGLQAQPSAEEALTHLTEAVRKGLSITIKHPIRQRTLHVVPESLKTWNDLEELWHKVLPGKQAASSTSQAQVADNTDNVEDNNNNDNDDNDDEDNNSSGSNDASVGYTSGQFGGMAFAMLLVGMLLGVAGVYIALRRFRPDIHLLPYQQSK